MRRTWWRWARLLGGVAILVVLVGRLGTGPFRDAIGDVTAGSLVAAAAIGLVTTVACAWRWRLVARGLGVDVPLPTAVAAYYRSLLLNSTLPGGVVGDVHRGLRRGRETGAVGASLRSVLWERTAGQVVQAVLTLVVLLAVPSAVRSAMPLVLVGAAAVVVVMVAALLAPPWRLARRAAHDLRSAVTSRAALPGVVLASATVVVGHAATFVVAARTAGVTTSTLSLLPLAALVLLAMSVPINVAGGWGPREGVSAWVFGAAGLGAAQGVRVGVVYGVLALVSVLPGAAVLAATRRSPAVQPVGSAVHG